MKAVLPTLNTVFNMIIIKTMDVEKLLIKLRIIIWKQYLAVLHTVCKINFIKTNDIINSLLQKFYKQFYTYNKQIVKK